MFREILFSARNTPFLVTKALELILYSAVLLAKPLEELSNLKLPRNLSGNPSQLPDNPPPALLKARCSAARTRGAVVLGARILRRSFRWLPLSTLPTTTAHKHLPGAPEARAFSGTC